MTDTSHQRATPLSLAAPLLFALIWASSYITTAIGVRDMSPCFFVAVRLVIATGITFILVALLPRLTFPKKTAWPHLMVAGALMHGLTLTTAHVALLSVKAAPIGLAHAFHPVLTAAFGVSLLGENFAPRQWLGMAIGLIGVALVLSIDRLDGPALALVGASTLGLTGGTLYLKRFSPGVSPFEGTAVQFAGGALFAIAATSLFETPSVNWTPALQFAFAWNIAFVSILAMALYTMMLTRGQAGRAASTFFIVPGAAALFGYLFLDQSLSPLALAGLALATFGVWLVWRKAG